MKLVSLSFFLVTLLLLLLVPAAGLLLPVLFGAGFGAYGVARSFSKHLDPLNDVPNALRVFLASLGGYMLTLSRAYIFPAIGVILLVGALFLNDEFQRRALHSMRTGRKGGSVAFLGIDGSGKSSHSTVTGRWLEERGYTCTVMPFHRYIFVERLAAISSALGGRRGAGTGRGGGGTVDRFQFKRGGNLLRPVASLLDNLLLQLSTSIGCRIEGRVVIYDRFIWSTYIKYKALGYPVKPISGLYLSPRPTFALVLNVPVEKSLNVIDERVTHIHYPREVLESEREQYLEIARRNGYPVIDATASFEEVQGEIESHLDALFPRATRGAS
jgi:thymidylate kinase